MAEDVEFAESVSIAMLTVLETLAPAERAVFVLREVFDLPYADIAAAVTHYRSVTGDETLEIEVGLELLVETARLWISLGHHDLDGVWHIAGVTGPDEYTAIVNDNVFTNLAAAHNPVSYTHLTLPTICSV